MEYDGEKEEVIGKGEGERKKGCKSLQAQSHEQQHGMTGGAEGCARGVQGLTDLHLEVVEGVLIDVLHLLHEVHGVVGQCRDVAPALAVVGGRVEP